MANIKVKDIKVAGTELFADSESFLNELTDSETVQVKGAGGFGSNVSLLGCNGAPSTGSALICL